MCEAVFSRMKDHPRIRGEHWLPKISQLGAEGSSPHTRGARGGVLVDVPAAGIIPAYAGSTSSPTRRPSKTGGSSPHTRGAHHGVRADDRTGRIIPAYAGSTRRRRRSASSSRDHPRIRGEHPAHYVLAFRHAGSSPHTRGAQGIGEICTKLGRIIPAYAGSTRSAPILMTLLSDHPRIRGEHRRTVDRQTSRRGSSPHTRGARTG